MCVIYMSTHIQLDVQQHYTVTRESSTIAYKIEVCRSQ